MKLLKISLFLLISLSFCQEPGDQCDLENSEVGFLDCNLSCYALELLDNIGNGSCDDGIDCCD